MSRVSKGAAAGVVGDDSELIAKVAEYERLCDEDKPHEGKVPNEEESDARYEALIEAYPYIVSAPIHTVQGIAAKLRALKARLEFIMWGDDEETVLASVMAALERIEVPADIVPVSVESDPFIALAAEWKSVHAEHAAARSEAESEPILDRMFDVEGRIADTPATTFLGVITKLRAIRSYKYGEPDQDDRLVKSALEGAERLLSAPVSRVGDDSNLLALVVQWREANDEHKRVVREKSVVEETTGPGSDPDGDIREEKALDAVAALERRIIRNVPAATAAGLAAKLEIAFDITGAMPSRRENWSTEDWSLWSCWQDAKRLAGGVVPPAQPDPAVDLARRWINEMRAFQTREVKTDEEADAFERDVLRPIETAMLDTEPVTAEGVVAMIAVALDLERDDKGDVEADAPYYDRFVFALMEKAGRFEAARRGIPAEREPDRVLELVRAYHEAQDGYLKMGEAETAEAEAARDNAYIKEVLDPAEDALTAAIPTTREGVVAVLNVALSDMAGKNVTARRFFENARDAVKGGTS